MAKNLKIFLLNLKPVVYPVFWWIQVCEGLKIFLVEFKTRLSNVYPELFTYLLRPPGKISNSRSPPERGSSSQNMIFLNFCPVVLVIFTSLDLLDRYGSNPDPKQYFHWFFFYSCRRRKWRICAGFRRWVASLLSLITAFRQSSRLGATPHGSNNRWRHPP